MNKSFILIAGTLAFSAGLALQAAPNAALERHKYDKLQDELILMAQADYKHARDRYVRSHPAQARAERRDQGTLTGQWRDYEHKRELRHADLGKFADIYRQPSLPAHAQYTRQDQVFGVDVKYSKATGAYNNSGILMDIAQASITDGNVRLQDALLASKLVAAPQVARHQNDRVMNNAGAAVTSGPLTNDGYLGYLADKNIIFNGQRERIEAGFNLARYFFQHRIGLGLFVPVVQDKRDLSLDLMSSIEDVTKASMVGAVFPDNLVAFNRRYGNSSQAFLADAFKAKGINSFGGTSTGLGDVQLYTQVKMSTKYLDRILFNARVIIPTAPQASTEKLWAPDRGNGGFYQTGLSFSAVGHYNRYFNPHYFIEGLYSLPAVVPQRVPVKMNIITGATSLQLGAATPLGYRLDNAVSDYNGFDVAFRNLGDTVSKLKLAKGLAFDMHIGNVFEQVFVRRAFLDVFYNFKIKARDRAYGLPLSDFNIEQYEHNSDQLEHRLGGEWRWQVNQAATLRLGIEQVVRGKNIAQDTQVSAGINYGF